MGTASSTGHAIVGIGASAGGLEALEEFFDNCPEKTGMSYIVVQHLSPDHKSLMRELLTRHTKMNVVVGDDEAKIEPDTIYLIPPAKFIEVKGNKIIVTNKPKYQLSLPIDVLFLSMAKEFGSNAIGVILSGTGSDGTRGAMAISDHSGLVIAQDPEEAKFDGMPRSVIATGVVDLVLQVADIPRKVVDFDNHTLNITSELRKNIDDDEHELSTAQEAILQLLHEQFSVDFSHYKQHTLERRILHRMQVLQKHDLQEYLRYLNTSQDEPRLLLKEMLIAVTRFFRDEEAFQALNESVIEPLVKNTPQGNTIRVWISACSTGEEAYSLTILFLEAFKKYDRPIDLKIFATDVNQQCIEYASTGVYPESIKAEVPSDLLRHYFEPIDEGYRVRNELRQYLVFARHNLIDSPPFTHMHLVSCRNMLIYLNNKTQSKVLSRLIYAVTNGGFLFLGTSESLSVGKEYTKTISTRHRLYQRIAETTDKTFISDVGSNLTTHRMHRPPIGRDKRTSAADRQAHQKLLDVYLPPAIQVNQSGDILRTFGNISHLVDIQEGVMSHKMSDLLPNQLATIAASLIHKSAKQKKPIGSDTIRLTLNRSDSEIQVRLNCIPIFELPREPYFLIVFEPIRQQLNEISEPHSVDDLTVERISILEQELDATRDYLQATVEDLETTNEELQATNEELMSSNEELQSSNEELQSVNEELNTINVEYQQKVSELHTANADLESMSMAVGVGTMFVDDELNIVRFSPDCKQLFNIRDSDVGRPLGDFSTVIEYPDLIDDLKETIKSNRQMEIEITTENQGIYLVRIVPYEVNSSGKRGAVASFSNIAGVKNARALQSVIDSLDEHIAVLKPNGMIAKVNRNWKRFAQANGDPNLKKTCQGVNYLETLKSNQQSDQFAKVAYKGIKGVMERSMPFFKLKYPCHSPDEKRWFLMSASPIDHPEFSVVVSHFNITEWYEDDDVTEELIRAELDVISKQSM